MGDDTGLHLAGAQFRLLGPVGLWLGPDEVDLGPARQRCVLVALLLADRGPVPTAELVDRVWGDQPPARAREVLYGYLTRLRHALRPVDVQIRQRCGSYQVVAPAATVDLHRFRQLVHPAPRAPVAAAERARILRAALDLWHGRALDGVSSDWVERTRASLERQRINTLVELMDLELRLGRHGGLVDELSDLVERHPTVEPLARQLMLALYRSGRPGEALAVYRTTHAVLVAELGLRPGPDLRALEAAILAEDPGLRTPPPPVGSHRRHGAGRDPTPDHGDR